MRPITVQQSQGQDRDEPDIITRILRGEKELFEILVRRNNQKLYRVIRSYLQDEDEIEDVMQDAYLKAFENLAQFRHSSVFSTWLIRIAINEALARLRRRSRVYTFADLSESGPMPDAQIPDTGKLTPDKTVINDEMKQMLEKAIDDLDQAYRTVYVLREVEGLSVQEVAECLEMTPANVKVRLHRARVMLRDKLMALARDADVFEFGGNRCNRITHRVMAALS